MNNSKNLFIVYLPYLCMKNVEEIDFGFAKVWNFTKKRDVYISNTAVKEKLTKILETNVSYNDPLKGIGIVSIGATDFRQFDEFEKEKVRLARLMLFLCFLSKNNTSKPGPLVSHWMATSENFDVVYQSFTLDNDSVSEETGAIVRFLIGGFELEETKFQKPNFVPTPAKFQMDEEMKKSLLELKTKRPRIFKRIINATEIFLESYYNSPYVSRNARILLQMSAFEILLNLPSGREQRKHFKENIEKYFALPNEKIYSHYWTKPRTPKHKESLTIKGLWADSFYLLRNKIIHGDFPPIKEFRFKRKQWHWDIALLFFILCIKKQIEKSLRKYPCNYEIRWEKWKDNLSQPKPFKSKRFIQEGFVYKYSIWRVLQKLVKSKRYRKVSATSSPSIQPTQHP